MRIPNGEEAVVDIRKLADYCLNASHLSGRHKARIFRAALGIGREDAAFCVNGCLRPRAKTRLCKPRKTLGEAIGGLTPRSDEKTSKLL